MEFTAQELFPCNVALCPKTLKSKTEFEEHILVEHGKKNPLDVVVSTEFDFDPDDSETISSKTSKLKGEFNFDSDDADESEDLTHEAMSTASKEVEVEIEKPDDKIVEPVSVRIPPNVVLTEVNKHAMPETETILTASKQSKTEVERHDDITAKPVRIPPNVVLTEVSRKSYNKKKEKKHLKGFDNLNSGVKLEPVFPVIKTETVEKVLKKTKQLQSNVVHRIGRMQENLIRNKSAFSIEKIEALTKIKLSSEARLNFETLINGGRDMEIYSQIFGNIFCVANLPSSVKCRSWLCRSCPEGKFLGSREEFEAHFNIFCHGKVLYTCELCNKTQKSFEVLKGHLKSKHFTDAKCDLCEELFPTEGKLLTHKLNAHAIGGFQCDMCTKMCPSMARLKVHVKENHSGLSFSCSTCMKVFKSKGACVAHEAIHSGKVYECEYCIDTFISETGKAKHVKFQHTLDYEKFTCEECGKEFGERTKLTSHMKFHQRHKDLVCEVCGKLFNKKYAKSKHKKVVHDNIRSHACNQCFFKTTSQAKLKHHIMKTHENHQEVCFLCNNFVKHPYHHVLSAHKDKPNAWKEYMERKKTATKLLKSRTKQEVQDLSFPFLENLTKAISTGENDEVLPSDFDIYPDNW